VTKSLPIRQSTTTLRQPAPATNTQPAQTAPCLTGSNHRDPVTGPAPSVRGHRDPVAGPATPAVPPRPSPPPPLPHPAPARTPGTASPRRGHPEIPPPPGRPLAGAGTLKVQEDAQAGEVPKTHSGSLETRPVGGLLLLKNHNDRFSFCSSRYGFFAHRSDATSHGLSQGTSWFEWRTQHLVATRTPARRLPQNAKMQFSKYRSCCFFRGF